MNSPQSMTKQHKGNSSNSEKKYKSFFDMTDKQKKRIVERAARLSTEEQIRKYGSPSILQKNNHPHSKKKCKHGFPLFQSCSKCGRNMVCSPFCDTKHDSFTECNSNNTPPQKHTTHYACKEVMERDGGKAVGCCCTGHKCKEQEEDLSGLVIGPGTTKKQESGGWDAWIDSEYFEIVNTPENNMKFGYWIQSVKIQHAKELQEAERRGIEKAMGKISKLKKRDRKDEEDCIRDDKHSWVGKPNYNATCHKCGADRFGICRFNDGYNFAVEKLHILLKK